MRLCGAGWPPRRPNCTGDGSSATLTTQRTFLRNAGPRPRRDSIPRGRMASGFSECRCTKVIVVDDRVAPLSRANLTSRAMETNLEYEILIRGGLHPAPSVGASPSCGPDASRSGSAESPTGGGFRNARAATLVGDER